MSHSTRKPSMWVCDPHGSRSACRSVQSNQAPWCYFPKAKPKVPNNDNTSSSTSEESEQTAEEAVKVLKILTSSKAPIIKKRQAMRNTFGDYRKKMQEEEKKSTAAAKKIKLSNMEKSELQKSQFFKKSGSKSGDKDKASTTPSESVTDIGKNFQFNFSISETNSTDTFNTGSEGDKPEAAVPDNKGESTEVGAIETSTQFKFAKSSNDFKFGFAVPDET